MEIGDVEDPCIVVSLSTSRLWGLIKGGYALGVVLVEALVDQVEKALAGGRNGGDRLGLGKKRKKREILFF